MSLDFERLLQCSQHSPTDLSRSGRLVEAAEHDRELVAAEPRDGVVRMQMRTQANTDFGQEHVAGVMPERIVDFLEAVEIDEQ